MPNYIIEKEFVMPNGARHLAGNTIQMSEDQYDELVEFTSKANPPVEIKLTEVDEPKKAEGKRHISTMKPIELPTGMTPADIPWDPPPPPQPRKAKAAAPAAHTASKETENRAGARK